MISKKIWRFFAPVVLLAFAMWVLALSLGCGNTAEHAHSADDGHDHAHEGHDHSQDSSPNAVETAWQRDSEAIAEDPQGVLKSALAELRENDANSDAATRVWRIAQYDLQQVQEGKAPRAETIDKALAYLEQARESGTGINSDVREMITEEIARLSAAKGDWGKAEKYARALLEENKDAEQWEYGNAIHEGHMILGQVAVAKGDYETAGEHLVEAGKSPGSPQIASFGPMFPLADTLIEHGEHQAVISYLEGVRSFWKNEAVPFDAWIDEIRGKKAPEDGVWKAHTRNF